MNTGVLWLVEEKDYITGDILFSKSYPNYYEALDEYTQMRNRGTRNTVSLEKREKTLLQE